MRVTERDRVRLGWVVLVPTALAIAWYLGRAMALGGNRRYAFIALGVVILLVRPVKIFFDRRIGPGAMAVEVPVLLMLASTIVLRIRSADALSANSLDSAGIIRVVCISLALMLGALALISAPRPEATPRRHLTTLPFRVYLCYIGVVLLGVPGSVKPFLTAYRAVELIAGCVVLMDAYRAMGNAAARRIEATIYWFTTALVASVWIGRIIDPSAALSRPVDSAVPLKWELQGIYPTQAANTVGALGALLAIWSLCRFINRRGYSGRRWVALVLTLVGIVTTIAAQYRTGYIAFVVAALVVFWLRQRLLLFALMAVAVFVIALSPTLVMSAQPYVLRGQSPKEAQGLSGRTDYWSAAVPVWERSPIIGRGLWTASRFEVLAPLGLENTASVHSTWVEALVGTGLLGLTLLAGCVLIALRRAWRVARASPWAPIGPLALMVLLTVRSLTGNLFESAGHEQLVFLAVMLALEDPLRWVVRAPRVTATLADDRSLPASSTA